MPRTLFDSSRDLASARNRRGIFGLQRRGTDGSACGEEVLDSGYAMAVITDDPVAYYQCQDFGGLLRDSIGGNSLLDYFNGATTGLNRLDGPLTSSCDKSVGGTIDFAMFRETPMSTLIDDFTMECWVYPGDVSSNTFLFYNGYGGNDGYGIYPIASGGSLYMGAEAGGVITLSHSATAIAALTWNHLVLQRDAGTWKYFINGVSDGTYGTTAPSTPGSSSTHGGVWISNGTPAGPDWRVAHCAIYESVLSSARIAAHYAAR